MEIEVLSNSRNPLLGRYEVTFEVKHSKEPTPKVYELRKALSSLLASKMEVTLITRLRSRTGEPKSIGEAHIYNSEDEAKKAEPVHVIILNMEPSARREELKRLAQKRAEAKAAIKKGGKR
jgi:small subunit ribosomal protein S24e